MVMFLCRERHGRQQGVTLELPIHLNVGQVQEGVGGATCTSNGYVPVWGEAWEAAGGDLGVTNTLACRPSPGGGRRSYLYQ